MTKKTTTTTAPDNRLHLGLCPYCGTLQLCLPTEDGKGVTIGIDHRDAVGMVAQMAKLLMTYEEGTLGDFGYVTIACCDRAKEVLAPPHSH